MSVERQEGIIVFVCDVCMDELITDERDWDQALDAKQFERWGSRKEDGAWIDVCEFCKERSYD